MEDSIISSDFESDDELYRGVKSEYTKQDGPPKWRAFYSRNTDGLSVDWSKLSTPEQSLERLNKTYICIASVTVDFIFKGIKELFPNANLSIVHDEKQNNKAHCLIKGRITEGMAKQFARKCKVVASRM